VNYNLIIVYYALSVCDGSLRHKLRGWAIFVWHRIRTQSHSTKIPLGPLVGPNKNKSEGVLYQ